jgi:murein DD-endopeptidase MepM/ murein hydrolase activator NlpD
MRSGNVRHADSDDGGHCQRWRTALLALLGICCLSGVARAADSTGFYLSFPVSGYTPFTAPASSAFDHASSSRYVMNGTVYAYPGVVRTTSSSGSNGGCYSNGQQVTLSGLNYVGARSYGAQNALCYDGHPGWDYAFGTGTEIRAAADGWVYDVTPANEPASGSGCSVSKPCGTVYVRHDQADTIRTYYLHLSVQSGRSGSRVVRGEIIGRSGMTGTGSAHLHFEVRRRFGSSWGPGGAYSVDPYGTFSGDPHPQAAQMPSLWTAPSTPPAPPSRTFASPLSWQSVRVGWDDNSGNELGFRVYRWNPVGLGSWALMASLGQNSVSYTDSGLQSSTAYYYKVCSWNWANSASGACDGYAAVSTPAPPPFQAVFFVDGASASTRPQGRTFTFVGAGFTPYGPVDRQLYNYATSTWTRLSPQLWADGNGTLIWQYTPPCSSSALGRYYVWVYDYSRGRVFNVWETVTPGTCQ